MGGSIRADCRNEGQSGVPYKLGHAILMLTDVSALTIVEVPNAQLASETGCGNPVEGGAKGGALDRLFGTVLELCEDSLVLDVHESGRSVLGSRNAQRLLQAYRAKRSHLPKDMDTLSTGAVPHAQRAVG